MTIKNFNELNQLGETSKNDGIYPSKMMLRAAYV
tara:strand:- start:85117 stop:85218 length:102 start_codon:yes stop_codon:yes gene_type:complete